MLHSNSLFTTAPILILAFIRYKDSRFFIVDPSLAKWIWLISLSYAVVYGLAAPHHTTYGIHWGNRLLLVLHPLFAVLAAINLVHWFTCLKQKINWRTLVIALAILASFAAQVYSIRLLHKKKSFSFRLNQEIQKRPEKIIVTNLWWVPQALFSEFYNKLVFRIRSPEQYEQLRKKLCDSGYKKYLFVTQTSDERAASAVAKVNDEGLNFFSLKFFVVHLPDSR